MSFDWLFWYDESPEYREYLNQPWSYDSAPVTEAIQGMIESFRTGGKVFGKALGQITHTFTPGGPVRGPSAHLFVKDEAILPIPSFFTSDLGRIEDDPGTDTHDDQGRPLLDASGGPRRQARVCPRHGAAMPHGWCPRCK